MSEQVENTEKSSKENTKDVKKEKDEKNNEKNEKVGRIFEVELNPSCASLAERTQQCGWRLNARFLGEAYFGL